MNAKNKTCRVCQTRPIAGGTVKGHGDTDRGTAKAVELCLPCLAEAGWENEHSDYAHENYAPVDPSGYNDLSQETRSVMEAMVNCWMCHPELNEAAADYVAKTGTSRQGMIINVPIRATGIEKAEHVMAVLGGEFATSIAKPTKRNGQVTTLKAAKGPGEGAILKWDAAGRFLYGPSTVNGKRVRNLAGALRALGA